MKLFHGSNLEIFEIDLAKGRKGKDFGKGFYLSPDLLQAQKMAQTVTLREECGRATVTIFEFNEKQAKQNGLQIKKFDGYSIDWVQFVHDNRKNKTDQEIHNYDIVFGPIANDTVGLQIRRFDMNLITAEQLVNELQYKQETYQYFFGTEEAVACLKKISVI